VVTTGKTGLASKRKLMLNVTSIIDVKTKIKKGEADDVVVPRKEELMEALKTDPIDSTVEQKRAVQFFHDVPLISMEKSLKNVSLMQKNTSMELLKHEWPWVMGTAMTLVTKASDVTNILHNHKKEAETSDLQQGQESDLDSTPPTGNTEKSSKKQKKAKMVTKRNREEIKKEWYESVQKFMNIQANEFPDKKNKVYETYIKWEEYTGLKKKDGKTSAMKRGPVEPVDEPPTKKALKEQSQWETAISANFFAAFEGVEAV
jgi:hypothetical protein